VDLSTLSFRSFSDKGTPTLGAAVAKGKRNTVPFPAKYDGVLFLFSDFAVDVTKYTRITINAQYFDAKGVEIPQSDGKAMVVLIYDPAGDLKGPEMGPGKNTPLKEFNLGGFSGMVNTDKGSRVNLSKAPGALLIQCSDDKVKFIEVTQITFHLGSASGAE